VARIVAASGPKGRSVALPAPSVGSIAASSGV
jgi:hypothetical protein